MEKAVDSRIKAMRDNGIARLLGDELGMHLRSLLKYGILLVSSVALVYFVTKAVMSWSSAPVAAAPGEATAAAMENLLSSMERNFRLSKP